MAEQDNQHKPLAPSERKLRKARQDGQAVRSKDLGHFFVMLSAGAMLIWFMPYCFTRMQTLLNTGLIFDAKLVANESVMMERLSIWAWQGLMMVAPLGLVLALAAVAAGVSAGGWVFSPKTLLPNPSKLNPLSGIARIFSKQQLIDAIKASTLGVIVGVIGGWVLWQHWPNIVQLLSLSLPSAFNAMGHTLSTVFWTILIALAFFAMIDWPLQRFNFMQTMRMTHQEMKDELKQSEGSPEIKARVKQRMREMARKRMLAAIPTADLVVMNPSHYAVALQYDETKMGAPRVVAKGLDFLAFKIRDLATENKVPVLEAPPLARALYANCQIDQEVPMALYNAVAQVLAYVYQIKAAMSGKAPMPEQMPDLLVPAELDPLTSAHLPANHNQGR